MAFHSLSTDITKTRLYWQTRKERARREAKQFSAAPRRVRWCRSDVFMSCRYAVTAFEMLITSLKIGSNSEVNSASCCECSCPKQNQGASRAINPRGKGVTDSEVKLRDVQSDTRFGISGIRRVPSYISDGGCAPTPSGGRLPARRGDEERKRRGWMGYEPRSSRISLYFPAAVLT